MEKSWTLDVLCVWRDWSLEWASFEDHSAYWLALGPLRFNFLCAEGLDRCHPLNWREASRAIADWLMVGGQAGHPYANSFARDRRSGVSRAELSALAPRDFKAKAAVRSRAASITPRRTIRMKDPIEKVTPGSYDLR